MSGNKILFLLYFTAGLCVRRPAGFEQAVALQPCPGARTTGLEIRRVLLQARAENGTGRDERDSVPHHLRGTIPRVLGLVCRETVHSGKS